jgi:hypothetical protein
VLDLTAKSLHAEIQAAERFRDLHLGTVEKMVQEYCGEGYRSDWQGSWTENHFNESIRLNTAKVVFDNPKVRVRTRRTGTQRPIAKAMRWAVNRWTKDTKLRRLLKRLYVTQSFSYAVAQTVMEPHPWLDPRDSSIPQWPMCYEIPGNRWFFDPLCLWYGSARYAGHKYIRDKADVLEEAKDKKKGWDRDAVEAISAGAGVEDFKERKDNERGSGIDRKELAIYEVWVPEQQMRPPSEGFHGALYTLAVAPSNSGDPDDEKAGFIREPRPYYGPRCGPYTLYGVYPVPGDPYPLSPFAAMYRQIRELNEITRAANEAVRDYKRVLLVSADSPDLAKKLSKAPDSFVIPVKGFKRDQVEVVESGGITSQHKDQIRDALDRVDRNTGIDQVQRGNLEKGLTATAVAVAEASSSSAIAFVKQEFTDATVQVLDSAAWFMYNEDRVAFPLGEEAADELGMGEPWFVGGMNKGAKYDDLELEIEPYSMERMNEALARSQYMDMVKLIMEAGPAVLGAPFFHWKSIFERGGDVLNDPMLGDVYNAELAARLAGMQAAQGMASTPTGLPSSPQGGGLARQFAGRVSGGQLGAQQRKAS